MCSNKLCRSNYQTINIVLILKNIVKLTKILKFIKDKFNRRLMMILFLNYPIKMNSLFKLKYQKSLNNKNYKDEKVC